MEVRAKVREMMDSMRDHPAYVVSTGCDLPQEIPPESVAAFITAARSG